MLRKLIAMLLCVALLGSLAGCGSLPAVSRKPDKTPAETTQATEPAPTSPADGRADDVTCKGTYYVSDEDAAAAADAVVATMGSESLTNGQLQIYYWLEVAAHRISDHPEQPDFSQSLDTQSCPIDESVNSWQQYFLRRALSAWQTRQALVLMGQEEGVPPMIRNTSRIWKSGLNT